MTKPIIALLALLATFLLIAGLFPLRAQQATVQIPVPGIIVTIPATTVTVPAITIPSFPTPVPAQPVDVPPSTIAVSVGLTGLPAGCTVSWTNAATAITGAISCPVIPPPPPPLKITTPIALPQAKVGSPYSTDISLLALPTGGTAPYSFALGSDAPPWATMTSAGILSGTPTASGNLTFSFTVSDSSGTTSANNLKLRIPKGGR